MLRLDDDILVWNGSSTCMRKLTHRPERARRGRAALGRRTGRPAIGHRMWRAFHRTQLATGSGALRRPLRRVPPCGGAACSVRLRSVRSWGGTTRPSTHTGGGRRVRLPSDTRRVRLVSFALCNGKNLGIGSPRPKTAAGFRGGRPNGSLRRRFTGPGRFSSSGAGC